MEKISPTHESPFNLKNWSGKSQEFEKLVGEKWVIFQKWLNFSLTKIFPDKVVLVYRKCSVRKGVLENFANFTGKYLCWSLFIWSCKPSACKFFKNRLQHKCFPVKFAKVLRIPIFRNICKRLLLEVFYKKAHSEKLCNIRSTKVASNKCSVKKLFLVVDRAVKETCFNIDQHLL